MCVNDDSVAVSPATSASVTAPATTGAPSATTGIAHENDNDNDEDDGGDGDDGDDGDNDNTAISSGSDTNVSSPTAAGPADNTDSTSISVNEPPSDTNVASELGPESNNSSIVDNSDASDLSDSGSDIVNNIGTLSEFSELDTEVSSDDDWFESLKSSASTLPVGTQRICLTVLSTLAFSAAFTWIL
ncbi:hypothetical protein LPJ76_001424 [Coemansia sp. RSA 638]|nr:hypothetical protein LPJ76_001424 [Coemansia sp. RSA 638]